MHIPWWWGDEVAEIWARSQNEEASNNKNNLGQKQTVKEKKRRGGF